MIKSILTHCLLFLALIAGAKAFSPDPCTPCEKKRARAAACENCTYTRPLIPYHNPFEYPDNYNVTNDSDRADPYGDVGYTFT